jgi:hypothetical protein
LVLGRRTTFAAAGACGGAFWGRGNRRPASGRRRGKHDAWERTSITRGHEAHKPGWRCVRGWLVSEARKI